MEKGKSEICKIIKRIFLALIAALVLFVLGVAVFNKITDCGRNENAP